MIRKIILVPPRAWHCSMSLLQFTCSQPLCGPIKMALLGRGLVFSEKDPVCRGQGSDSLLCPLPAIFFAGGTHSWPGTSSPEWLGTLGGLSGAVFSRRQY